MTAPPVIFVGWGSDDRVPGAYGESVFAAGALRASDIPLKCLVTGTQLPGALAVPSRDIHPIRSREDANLLHGPGCELAIALYTALGIPGINLFSAPTAEAPNAVAATATIAIGGAWARPGLWQVWLDGTYLSGTATGSDTPQTVATAIATAVMSDPELPATAAPAAGPNGTWLVTLARKSKGARGNDGALYIDRTRFPPGMRMDIAGGALMSGDGVHFGGGVGTEDVTPLLSALFAGTYDRIAVAQNDAINAQRWRAYAQAKAGVLEGRLEQLVFGTTGTLTAAQALGQTTLNEFRAQVVWLLNGECHPSQLAASMAALRTVSEQDNPVAYYDDVILPGIPPQRVPADRPQHSTLKAALQNSVTPLYSTNDGYVRVSMAITTYSLRGAIPDYRCLQTYYVTMPDYARRDITIEWATAIKPEYPGVADDPAPEEPPRAAGIWTPERTDQWLTGKLQDYEKRGWVIDVLSNRPKSGFEPTAKRVHSLLPVKVAPRNHQYGISVRQFAG